HLPAAARDAVQRRLGLGGADALLQKPLPVVLDDGVQRPDQLGEVERPDLGRAVLAAAEGPAEVVQALLAAGLLADQRVGVEPEQGALVVEVHAAAAAPSGTVQWKAYRSTSSRCHS